jgi:aubergine
LRNGCADSQISTALEHEVKEVQKGIENAAKKSERIPSLTYIIVDKNCSQKLFKSGGDRISNAPWGTLVNSKIVSNDYDFYLVSQGGGIGTVKPGLYKVIFSNSKMEEGVLQELLYTQCFNYMNWSGSVKVPACLQYAKKLSTFIAQSVNSSKNSELLNKNLYFI